VRDIAMSGLMKDTISLPRYSALHPKKVTRCYANTRNNKILTFQLLSGRSSNLSKNLVA
jgi:hypothetical protein